MTEATRSEILARYRTYVARFERDVARFERDASSQRQRAPAVRDAAEHSVGVELVSALTGREQDVLELIADGLTDSEIGAELGISEFTAKMHVKGLLMKLAARNRAHAVALA